MKRLTIDVTMDLTRSAGFVLTVYIDNDRVLGASFTVSPDQNPEQVIDAKFEALKAEVKRFVRDGLLDKLER